MMAEPNSSAENANGHAGSKSAGQLRPFFGFYGGKWRDTPRYYPEPRHDLIVEPSQAHPATPFGTPIDKLSMRD